jgi:hypothetical protein
MYPISRRPFTSGIFVLFLQFVLISSPAHAHDGGGGGHGGRSGGGFESGGSHAYPSGASLYRGWPWVGRSANAFAAPFSANSGWVGFPDELLEARIHRFFTRHIPHLRRRER